MEMNAQMSHEPSQVDKYCIWFKGSTHNMHIQAQDVPTCGMLFLLLLGHTRSGCDAAAQAWNLPFADVINMLIPSSISRHRKYSQ